MVYTGPEKKLIKFELCFVVTRIAVHYFKMIQLPVFLTNLATSSTGFMLFFYLCFSMLCGDSMSKTNENKFI